MQRRCHMSLLDIEAGSVAGPSRTGAEFAGRVHAEGSWDIGEAQSAIVVTRAEPSDIDKRTKVPTAGLAGRRGPTDAIVANVARVVEIDANVIARLTRSLPSHALALGAKLPGATGAARSATTIIAAALAGAARGAGDRRRGQRGGRSLARLVLPFLPLLAFPLGLGIAEAKPCTPDPAKGETGQNVGKAAARDASRRRAGNGIECVLVH